MWNWNGRGIVMKEEVHQVIRNLLIATNDVQESAKKFGIDP
jgi:hypothetical protein